MARFLALEWDNREARVAVASLRGEKVVAEQLLSVPLVSRDKEEGKSLTPQEIGEEIGRALDAAGIRRAETLVSVGRASVELKQLTLPPAPDEELPDMVRWQATRDFHSLGEDWPLDYLPLAGGEGNRTVLAAAFSPEVLQQFRATCQAAGLEVSRMVLRPVAAASMFLRSLDAEQEEVRLLIDFLSEEVDLTVLAGRDPVFMRTARLPHDVMLSLDNFRAPFPELRRTMAAAHNQLAGSKVQAIYLCGTEEEHGELARRIEQELGLPVSVFDPLSGLHVAPALSTNRPANSGRFAPLLGMLADELQDVPHGIDFLHPRRRPEPPSKRNKYVLAAAAVCAVALLGGGLVWQRLNSLDRRIATLEAQKKALEPLEKGAKELEKTVAEIRQWTGNEVIWLEELKQLSERFPESREAKLTNLRLSPHPEGGSMTLEGLVRESSTIDALEQGLRDERHSVKGEGRQQDRDNEKYRWQFKSTVVVKSQPAAGEAAKPATAQRQEPRQR